MCILLKLDHAKSSVSKLFVSKVFKEKPFFGPLVKEGLSRIESVWNGGSL